MEESGITEAKAIQEDIISLDILPVIGHMKNGKYVAAHLHFNVTYIFEVEDEATFQAKLDENSEVGWIGMDEVAVKCTEAHMIPIYEKIIEKVKKSVVKMLLNNTAFQNFMPADEVFSYVDFLDSTG